MKIWVDADACPGPVKDIIISATIRRAIKTVFVANKYLNLPVSEYLSFVQVNKESDAADFYIRENAKKSDLVISQDILLAQMLVLKGIVVVDPRGRKYTENNIGEIVATRNLMQELRDIGALTGGAKQFGDREKRAFASAFDQELTRLIRQGKAI
jgi:uncharacterized protein